MKSLALFVVLLVAVNAGPSWSELPPFIEFVKPDTTGKRLNIGANPVYPAGYPADSLKAHAGDGWHVCAFGDPSDEVEFVIWIECLDADSNRVSGWIDEFEPIVVSVPPELQVSPDTTIYRIHYVQKCGNPVLNGAVALPNWMPSPMVIPPDSLSTPPAHPPPDLVEEVLILPKVDSDGGRSFPIDGWFGAAGSKSLESKAWYAFQGLYVDFPRSSRWTVKTAAASSQANYWKNGGQTVHRGMSGDLSRLQIGMGYQISKDAKTHALIGWQYDHKNDNWQPGLVYEAWLGVPILGFWNEENATYQSKTYAFWFRSRHLYPIAGSGDRVWYLGAEGVYNSFHQDGERWYTTRYHGLVKYDFLGIADLPATFVFGVGRGSDHEAWGLIMELGHRLWF